MHCESSPCTFLASGCLETATAAGASVVSVGVVRGSVTEDRDFSCPSFILSLDGSKLACII